MLTDKSVFPEIGQGRDTSFGDLLKRLMRERNITGQELAETVGITPPSVSRILSGTSNPKTKTLHGIIKAIAKTPAEEEALMHAFHGAKLEHQPGLGKSFAYEDFRIVQKMESRASRANYRRVLERMLKSQGYQFERDYAEDGAATDFLLTLSEDLHIAIEAISDVQGGISETFGFAELILERLEVDKVLLVTPYMANVNRPEMLAEAIEMLTSAELPRRMQEIATTHDVSFGPGIER